MTGDKQETLLEDTDDSGGEPGIINQQPAGTNAKVVTLKTGSTFAQSETLEQETPVLGAKPLVLQGAVVPDVKARSSVHAEDSCNNCCNNSCNNCCDNSSCCIIKTENNKNYFEEVPQGQTSG